MRPRDVVGDGERDVALIEGRVGHPRERWDALKQRVQDEAVRSFAEVQVDWLALMWCLDAYRRAGTPPRGMGDPNDSPSDRLNAVYRGKGNWFAALVALLLENRTSQRIAPRQKVQGFSQKHQIDLAWPPREEDPRVCVETKVMGAPPRFGSTRARGALADYTNRRKELKFAATDLKLFRRQEETVIDHWGVWRENAPPRSYFLWAARLNAPRESIDQLVRQAKMLVDTYLDGAGIVAWRVNATGTAYEPVEIQPEDRVTTLDDVLHRVAAVIRTELGPHGELPPPVVPDRRAVQAQELPEDDD